MHFLPYFWFFPSDPLDSATRGNKACNKKNETKFPFSITLKCLIIYVIVMLMPNSQLTWYDILALRDITATAITDYYGTALSNYNQLKGTLVNDSNKQTYSKTYIYAMEHMLQQVKIYESLPSFIADNRDDETILCKYNQPRYYTFIEMT